MQNEQIKRQLDADSLSRAFRARLEAMHATSSKLVERHRTECAEALLASGLSLIPSEHLRDHEFVVSRGVYEAAMKLIKPDRKEEQPAPSECPKD